MFAGVGNDAADMLKELESQREDAAAAVVAANATQTTMQAQKEQAVNAVAKIPVAIGTWGIVWAAGIYWFILRPLLK